MSRTKSPAAANCSTSIPLPCFCPPRLLIGELSFTNSRASWSTSARSARKAAWFGSHCLTPLFLNSTVPLRPPSQLIHPHPLTRQAPSNPHPIEELGELCLHHFSTGPFTPPRRPPERKRPDPCPVASAQPPRFTATQRLRPSPCPHSIPIALPTRFSPTKSLPPLAEPWPSHSC